MTDPIVTITGQQAGTSEAAARAASRIMSLDGMAIVRKHCMPDFDAGAFAAAMARIIEEETAAGDLLEAVKDTISDVEMTFSPVELTTSETFLGGIRDHLRSALGKVPTS